MFLCVSWNLKQNTNVSSGEQLQNSLQSNSNISLQNTKIKPKWFRNVYNKIIVAVPVFLN